MLRSKIQLSFFMFSFCIFLIQRTTYSAEQQTHQSFLTCANNDTTRVYPVDIEHKTASQKLVNILFYSPENREQRLLMFLDKHPEFISTPNKPAEQCQKGETVAHILAHQRNWSILEKIIDQYDESCTSQTMIQTRCNWTKYIGSTPLLLICFIKPLIKTDDKIAVSIAEKLLKKRPDIALITRNDGMNPAHACVSQKSDINIALLTVLARYCPQSLQQITHSGCSVIDIIIQGEESNSSIQALKLLTTYHIPWSNQYLEKCLSQHKYKFFQFLKEYYQSQRYVQLATGENKCLCCTVMCYCCLYPQNRHQQYWLNWYQQYSDHPNANDWLTKYHQLQTASVPSAIPNLPSPPPYTAISSPPPYSSLPSNRQRT